MEKIYFTKDGLNAFLQKIKKDEDTIKEIAEGLGKSVEDGTWHDNFDYEQRKRDLDMLGTELNKKKALLSDIAIVENKAIDTEIIGIGSTVVTDFDGKNTTWSIVGYGESEPKQGKIAYNSRMGNALMKKKVGDSFDYQIGQKIVKIIITEIKAI